MSIYFKKAVEIADGVLDLASWLGKRMEGSKELVKPDDLIGVSAEVCATIKKGGVGEVVVVAGASRLNFSARAEDGDAEFKKGDAVKIIRAGSSMLFVADEKFTTSLHDVDAKVEEHTCCDHEH
ncbi:MAG: hypothetical protein K2X93_27620 [Candidatus Obscuribacterales bacterium]|nr:hypothetical protein [Candidatus Obscuribacterales bacterium]